MSSERYVGERRALWHFLSELQPLVVASLGADSLLGHRIDQALKAGDLQSLRNARRLFHNHPDELKRRLMRGIFEGTAAGEELPTGLQTESAAPPAAAEPASIVVRFEAVPAARETDAKLTVAREQGEPGDAPVQVRVEAGTLPRSAAEALRQIADWIEHDRRLLSDRRWTADDKQDGRADETLDQA